MDSTPKQNDPTHTALPVFLDLNDLKTLLHVSRRTVYRIVAHGNLPVYRPGRGMLFKTDDIAKFLEGTRVKETKNKN